MTGMPRTDGSVTAGGNTLIMLKRVFTLLHPFTFRPFDISSAMGSVPFFQDSDVFWALWPAAGLPEKSVNPPPPQSLPAIF